MTNFFSPEFSRVPAAICGYPDRVRLPLVEETGSPCDGCAADCCAGHQVPLTALDLLRLAGGLALPWRALAELAYERTPLGGGFRLDRGPVHHRFVLKRRASGACNFLIELAAPDGARFGRCGAHGFRPSACRAYPLASDGGAAVLAGHAQCPPDRLARWGAAAPSHVAEVAAAEGAWRIEAALRDRWDERARTVPVERPLAPERYLAFADSARAAVESAASIEHALAAIASLPLPD
jgi:Fe-S-cluster containining protein